MRLRTRANLASLCAAGVLVLGVAGPAASTPKKTHHLRAAVITAAPACPSNDTCVTIPPVCPSGQTCPTVQMGPATNLGPDQWVYLNMYGFEPGAQIHVAICTNTAPLPAAPLCITNGTTSLPIATYKVQAFADGSTSISYQVVELSATDPPLEGAEPGNTSDSGTFLCNDTSPCSIDVIDTGPSGQGSLIPTTANTAVVPFTFAPSTNGCPSATTVNTESEFGIDVLLPIQARLSCASSNPTFAFNTAIDGLTAMTDLSNAETQVAFTDDPQATTQQSLLATGGYALIPIALSANVIAFRSQMLSDNVLYPQNQLDLTPAMAAGLLTTAFQNPGNADIVNCTSGSCQVPPCIAPSKGAKGLPSCSLFTMLNYVSGFIAPQAYGGFVRSDDAGSTDQLFKWVCATAISPVTALGQTWTETATAAQVLEAGLSPLGKPLKTCPTSDQFPPVPAGASAYTAYNDPSQQALKMTAYVAPGVAGSATGNAAFASMNWADARYFGLSIASLQNSSGNFEVPNAASIAAAISTATTNPDGTLSIQATDSAAYAMPSVFYAVVPTTTYTAVEAAQIQNYLTQLLELTAGSETSDLPDGFVPLPHSLYQEALSDVAKDVHVGTPVSVTTTTVPTTPAPPSSSTSGQPSKATVTPGPAAGVTGSNGVTIVHYVAPGPHILTTTPVTVNAGGTPGVLVTPSTAQAPFAGRSILLASSSSRVLAPVAFLLGIVALILGGFLLLFAEVRRTLARRLQGMLSGPLRHPDRRRHFGWLLAPSKSTRSW